VRTKKSAIGARDAPAACSSHSGAVKPPPASQSAAPTNDHHNAPAAGRAPDRIVGDPATVARPVLVVKIDNVADAHPQSGINQADVVYEELVENSSTRLMVMFQSTDATPIGPIRSARPTDVLLFSPLNKPLFAWFGSETSGARDDRQLQHRRRRQTTPAVDQYYRDSSRAAPHNLFIQGYTSMIAAHQEDAGAPPRCSTTARRTSHWAQGRGQSAASTSCSVTSAADAPVDYSWTRASAAGGACRPGSSTSTPTACKWLRRT